MLKDWINPELLEEKKIKQINNKFLRAKPFEYVSIDNFLNKDKAKLLQKTLEKEEYYLEDHDLYQFLRTEDFKKTENQSIITFRNFLLSEEFISFLEKLTSSKIKRNHLDLHSLKLLDTNYLLCHDDMVEGRQFAFIFNLSEEFEKKDGGAFEIFDSDSDLNVKPKIVESIIPKFNRFNIFKVRKNSYHQISEVTSDKERISIGGWYHY